MDFIEDDVEVSLLLENYDIPKMTEDTEILNSNNIIESIDLKPIW